MRTSPRSAGLEGSTWEQSILMSGDQASEVSSSSSSYPHLSSATSTMSQKSIQQYPYPSMSSSSRTSTNSVYMSTPQPNYPHSADRPMGNTYNAAGFLLRDGRDETSPHHYSYSQPSFAAAHGATMESSSSAESGSQAQPRDAPSAGGLNFPHRRSLTDPQHQAFRMNHFAGLPNTILPQSEITLPSPPRLQDSALSSRPNSFGGGDGRLHSMS
jgi:hypothetical protein